ncbi:MAG: methionyl-tRNA formyltransferase [Patescibacteria group bacterium]
MKFAFLGTPEFAKIVLEQLIREGMPPTVVVCNPDRPVGRKHAITPPPVKILAEEHKIPVFQPETLIRDEWQVRMKGVEFAVVAAYAKILPKEILDIFQKGIIGVHPSLLPEFRGSTPIQSAIISGVKETGVTLFITDKKTDHGPILAIKRFKIASNDTSFTLMSKLAELGGMLLVETIPQWVSGKIKPHEQDHKKAIMTKKIQTTEAYINPEDLTIAEDGDKEKAGVIERKIRAFNPEPGAWTMKDGKRLKLLQAIVKDDKLVLQKIQWEGKKPTKK